MTLKRIASLRWFFEWSLDSLWLRNNENIFIKPLFTWNSDDDDTDDNDDDDDDNDDDNDDGDGAADVQQ